MDVIGEITDIVDRLDKLDEYFETLADELSAVDKKQQDLLHYIEYNPIKMLLSYKTLLGIKSIRKDRRKIKNDISLKSVYDTYCQRLLKKENRQSLLIELHKREKALNKIDSAIKTEEVEEFIKGVE